MRQFSKYLLEKLVIDSDTGKYTFEGSIDRNTRHICWLFARIDEKDVNDEHFPTWEEDKNEEFGPIAYSVNDWVKNNKVTKYIAIANKKALEKNNEDNDVIDYFKDDPDLLESICKKFKNQTAASANGRYELFISNSNYLLLHDYKNEKLSKLIEKV